MTPNLIFNILWFSCSKTLISLWRPAFRCYSFSSFLGGFCSFVHTNPNISESFQRRDWTSLKSSIFCDKTAHIKGVKKKSRRETKLRSREKWENQSMAGLSFSLGFSGLKNYQNICGSKGRWQVVKGGCLDVLKSRMTLVVKMSASKKGFISHDSILINDWNCAHLKTDSGAGVKTCLSEKRCNFRQGRCTERQSYNFSSLLKQFVQTFRCFNTILINVRSPL